MNGLDPHHLSALGQKSTLDDLLQMSVKQYNFTPAVQEHANPLLVKYLYYFDEGVNEMDSREECQELKSSKDLGSSSSSALALGDMPPTKITVKFEKLEQKELKDLHQVAVSCKKVLTPLLNSGSDLLYKIKVEAVKKDFGENIETLKTFVDELRGFIVQSEDPCQHDDQALKQLIEKGKHLKHAGVQHQECIKMKIKQAKTCC